MNRDVRWRLSMMMFLQYAVWGVWSPVIAAYFEKLGFSGTQYGFILSLLPLGCMIAPFCGGQLADRYISTEKLLAILHLAGGIFLCAMARVTGYGSVTVLMLLWALMYAPTLALTNSITFHHLPDAKNKFGLVRVWGTIGWIAAGLLLTGVRKMWPEGLPGLSGADSLWLGGFLSIALGLFCLALPHTPPAKSGESPWAFLSALKLLRDPSFAFFTVIIFVVSTELMFYYVLTAPFLETIGIQSANIPAVMTIAQAAEIGTMLALPRMLTKWGVRKTMALGILAWPIRYAVFAFGEPTWLVIAALSLHGVCYVCFFVVAYIHVDSVATPDIRASAQAFITFVALGAGMFIGSLFAGWIRDYFSTAQGTNYAYVFSVPCGLTILCALIFFLSFKERAASAQLPEVAK